MRCSHVSIIRFFHISFRANYHFSSLSSLPSSGAETALLIIVTLLSFPLFRMKLLFSFFLPLSFVYLFMFFFFSLFSSYLSSLFFCSENIISSFSFSLFLLLDCHHVPLSPLALSKQVKTTLSELKKCLQM